MLISAFNSIVRRSISHSSILQRVIRRYFIRSGNDFINEVNDLKSPQLSHLITPENNTYAPLSRAPFIISGPISELNQTEKVHRHYHCH